MSVAKPPFEAGDYVRRVKLTDRTTYRVLAVEKKMYRSSYYRKYHYTYFEYTLEEIIRHTGRPRKKAKKIGRWNRPLKATGGLVKCEPKPFPSWDYEDWNPEDVR